MGGGRRLIMAAATGVLATGVGCGAGEPAFPPAAEPAASPPLRRPPAGTGFAIGAEPEGLVVDGQTGLAAAITRDPSALELIDLDRRRVVERVALPATGRHLALERPGGPVLVPVEQTDELYEVALPGGEAETVAVGDHPHDAVAAAGRIFVGDEFADTISVIDAGHGTVTASLGAPEQPGGLAAAAGRVVAVAVAERVLAIYDARTPARVGVVDAGVGPTHVAAAGARAWIADTDGDAIVTVGLGADPAVISTKPAPGAPYGIAVDARRGRLWVTLTARNELVAYDVSAGEPAELARYPTLRQPNSVAVDPRSGDAVVAGRFAGRLQLIEAPR